MTIGTKGPRTIVFPGIDWEILAVMVEGGRHPDTLCMTRFTVCRELCRSMRRVGGLVVIGHMTAVAGGGRRVVVAGMTGSTGL